ncbi:family 10 glycosylhydrolase [Maribellus comscasis]|uniref:Alpha-galactosidase n=1 Tax=Maribellus comscasis TaxID=2681766 RepID=A0A6I6JSZ4_9BACT|nr:alpha-galactosidase [Maribellus comscasis]QGY46165.1 family 10 glycosylhydrolase [Maribellus comscasis]
MSKLKKHNLHLSLSISVLFIFTVFGIFFIFCPLLSNECPSFPVADNDTYTIETKNTSLVFTGKHEGKFLFQYYGIKPDDLSQILTSGSGSGEEAYPTFGINCIAEKALYAIHSDGNVSTNLYLDAVETIRQGENVSLTKVKLYDNKYPFKVTLYYRSYFNEDVIESWTVISHTEKSPVTLNKFASFYMPVSSYTPWLSHFHGHWANEFNLFEEKLERGMKVIKNNNGIRGTRCDNPSFMLSLDGKPSEDKGDVIAGTLSWTGTYKISFDSDTKNKVNIIAGINDDVSRIVLKSGEEFETPAVILTYSREGKGQASRNLHRWARNYGIRDGHKERMILLNSWGGVYFDITEDKMLDMISDIAALGGELFVMDDGWFGNKYPRNDETTSLGDWMVNSGKLPNGLDPLIKKAKNEDIKFGIWLEPEMTNLKSELTEKHPDWIVHQPNRETVMGRGGSQMLLDLCKPEVQDFVYHTIHDLLVKHPGIAYIKWDANHYMTNIGSLAIQPNNQSRFYIEYYKGFQKTLDRIIAEHPDVVLQACASGGGRVTYGYLKYFHEFWTSDNSDALSRIYMQWGTSHIFPAINMASHVSASPNHQTGRELPLKFRFDVAMTGRLGLEMQPKDLSLEEWQFSENAIRSYKSIRDIVQFGDLYRLISPYENNGIASLMYVSPGKERAVFFAFNLEENLKYVNPPTRLRGLDPDKKYRITEINKASKQNLRYERQLFTGKFLMDIGLRVNMRKAYQSMVVKITEID